MPTKYPQIAVTADPELADAVERARRVLGDRPRSELVRELALRGVEALEREDAKRRDALERLARLATRRDDLLDWDLLERIEEIDEEEELSRVELPDLLRRKG
jgi:hypothetical protein